MKGYTLVGARVIPDDLACNPIDAPLLIPLIFNNGNLTLWGDSSVA